MTKKKPKLTLAAVRKGLRQVLKFSQGNLADHGDFCTDEFAECSTCNSLHARIAAYKFAIKLAGGRVNE